MAEDKTTSSTEPSPPGDGGKSAFDIIAQYLHPGRENVMLIYVLYLAGLVPAFGGVPVFVGFILAVLNRREVGDPLTSHYEFQVRQAIIGFVAVLISALLAVIVIGFVGLVLVAIWWLIRSVKGLQALGRGAPIAEPKTYTW